MHSYLHQYPASLYSSVSDSGYRSERFTGEVLRSGRANRSESRRPRLRWFRRGLAGDAAQPRERRQPARPAPSPHHYELKFHRARHAGAR
jgi:hypothetical protein